MPLLYTDIPSGCRQGNCGVGLWSPDGRYLASSGNDNVFSVWTNHISYEVPLLYTLTQHQAAVKIIVG